MIVLALLTDGYGAGGGIAQYNRDLLGAVARADVCEQVLVLARHGTTVTADLPMKVRLLGISKGRLQFLARAALAVLRHPRIDVIFCGHLFMLPLAVMLAMWCGASVWLQLHGIEAWQARGGWTQRALARVSLITAVSRYTRRRFLQWAPISPDRVKVLPNTVSEEFRPGSLPLALQQRYSAQGRRVLLTVSRLAASERYKGHDKVIAAMDSLRNVEPTLLYLIAGEGDDRSRLETLVHQHQLDDHVRFIGFVSATDLPELYRLADVFVMPSSGEGFGIVFLQALASGIPVVAGDGDGSRDPLRDGVDGLLVKADDVPAIATALTTALAQGRTPRRGGAFDKHHFAGMVATLATGLGHSQKGQVGR